ESIVFFKQKTLRLSSLTTSQVAIWLAALAKGGEITNQKPKSATRRTLHVYLQNTSFLYGKIKNGEFFSHKKAG
ncbi:MAG: hypothetical protein ACYSPI_06175, partial [Planctomycetota bacterium]